MPPTWSREHRDPDGKYNTVKVFAFGSSASLRIHDVPNDSERAFASLTPARARAIAADLNAFADEAEPAPQHPDHAQDHADAAQRLDAVEKRVADIADVHTRRLDTHSDRLDAIARHVDDVDSRLAAVCDLHGARLDAVEKRLAALEGKCEVVGYRVRLNRVYSYTNPNDPDGFSCAWTGKRPAPESRRSAISLIAKIRAWEHFVTGDDGDKIALVRVTRRVRRA